MAGTWLHCNRRCTIRFMRFMDSMVMVMVMVMVRMPNFMDLKLTELKARSPMKLRNVFIIALSCLFLSTAAFSQQPSTAEQKAKLEKLQQSIKDLKAQLNEVKSNRDRLQKNLESSETEISDLMKKIESIRQEIKTEEQKLGQLKQQQKELLALQRSQTADIKQQMLATYRLGGESNIKLLLNQSEPEKVARVMKYYDYVLASRSDKLNNYVANLNELNRIEPEIQNKTETLQRTQNQLQQRHKDLQDKRAERKTTLAKLEATIKNKDQELVKLDQDQQQLQKLLTTVTHIVGSGTFNTSSAPFSKTKGKLSWPLKGKISHRYGSERIGKLKWDGVMIVAEEGTPVRAVHHGRVAFAQYYGSYGLAMLIEHGEGYFTFYAHNQTLHKKQDDWVEAGEVIATVGNSGGQQQSGLFFQVWHNLAKLNPGQWCG